MTTLETIGIISAFGVTITALATGLSYLHRILVKPRLKYRIDPIQDLGHLNINTGDTGNKDMGQIIGKAFKVENIGNRPSENFTLHVRANSKLEPAPHIHTNIKGYSIDLRGNEIYVYCDQLRAKGGRIVLQVFVLEDNLKLLKKPFLADYEVSDSLGKAKQVKNLKYIQD